MLKRFPFFYPLIVSLSLGLAPFNTEAHIIGKIRWLWGGVEGINTLDYFDTLLHGFPWIWLFVSVLKWTGLIVKKM